MRTLAFAACVALVSADTVVVTEKKCAVASAEMASAEMAVDETPELADVVHRAASAVSAASMIQGAATLADESEATDNMVDFPGSAFCLGMKIGGEEEPSMLAWGLKTEEGTYIQSKWDHVTVDLHMQRVKASKNKGYLCAWVSKSDGSDSGQFAYKQGVDGAVTDVITLTKSGKGSKNMWFKAPVPTTEQADDGWLETNGVMDSETGLPFTQFASHYAWRAPSEIGGTGSPGAFVFKKKDNTFVQFEVDPDYWTPIQ